MSEVSCSVWAKCQICPKCLEGLDEAVLLAVFAVTEVIFNRELIIWYNVATEQAAPPPPKSAFTHHCCNAANTKQQQLNPEEKYTFHIVAF